MGSKMEQNRREEIFILIVDDVEANRFVLKDIIADMGYRPVLAENGLQALKLLEHFRPQLMILDIAMPQMDGYELCGILKDDISTRDIPIIFISAFDDPVDIVKGFNLGGEDYVTKPFIPEVVKARVRLHLKLNDANKDLLEINRQLQVSVNEQMRRRETEKKNVLYALTRVARENAGYDETHMERLSYNCRVLAEAMQLSNSYDALISVIVPKSDPNTPLPGCNILIYKFFFKILMRSFS
jgi:putative two-component system response regulator